MIYTFEIPGTLPTLNQYAKAERTSYYVANRMKRETQDFIGYYAKKSPKFKGEVRISFEWIRPNARCDKDNVAFAKKFILDALQEVGVIESDAWANCTPFDVAFRVNKNDPRTIVTIEGLKSWK